MPDLLALHAASPVRYPFLFESSAAAGSLGSFDILAAFPGAAITLGHDSVLHGCQAAGLRATGFPAALNEACANGIAADRQLPFSGGWFVFLAYELAGVIEASLRLASEPGLPLAKAVRIPAAVIRERLSGRCLAIAEHGHEHLLEAIGADAARAARLPEQPSAGLLAGAIQEEDPARFLAAVAAAQRHIAAGEIYQANLSRRWSAEVAAGVEPWMLYASLRRSNPAPFGGIARLDADTAIISSSPERLVRVRCGRIETRPIAGTRQRSAAEHEQEAIRRSLLDNAKERAEHIMLIDLERNDLGRLCQPGSVQVDDFMTVESHAHVHHIVSGISGRLREDVGPGDMLQAVFPGGSITGCPKLRCMQLISELEGCPRGAYTGAMGYLNHDGSCDFNILIRTMVLQGSRLSFAAGSGIVADSVPALELAETRAKAKGMLLALQP
ncbi:MAG: aminodeoxychorismate synthase component I [Gammaproteobacteria bacterium]|nr:aminodeoxychorismate synthase component I [Gammaproteobacteria bacterium]